MDRINKTNIAKFSYGEAMSNSNGKTSGTKFAGDKLVNVGGLSFLICVVGALFKIPEMVTMATLAIGVITIGSGLLGYSKKHATKDTTNTIDDETSK